MGELFIAIGQATADRLWTAKGDVLLGTVLSQQRPSGFIPTDFLASDPDKQHFIYTNADTIWALTRADEMLKK